MSLSFQSVSLDKLFRDFPLLVYSPIPEVGISGIAIDSRQVQPGNLFVALIGGSADGHCYIPEAIEKGAVAVVGERPISGLGVPYIRVANSRQALTYLAAGFYDFPARNLTVIGVTGTDGKTTTTNLIYKILKAASVQAGMISTINAVIGEEVLDTGFHVTTPDAHDIQHYLARMVSAGLTHVVLETTSHGLAQHRVDSCNFDLGVITNITHEHLNEHGTFEAYRAAKGRLFSMLNQTQPKGVNAPRAAVLNLDDASFQYLSDLTSVPIVTYGLNKSADVRAVEINSTPGGLQFIVQERKSSFSIQCNLTGLYNVSNCLAAIAATVNILGVEPEAAQQGIAQVKGLPGRMERLELGQEFTAIVDFAHTPNALSCALRAARQMAGAKGKIIAVFGSAGLRDREKRRLMPEVAAQLADLVILTAEDPRTESLQDILENMAEALIAHGGREGKTFWRIPDRGQAIRMAVRMAHAGDVVIVCGKGHEQSMCFGTIEYPWDDRLAMHSALAERLGIDGPTMPYLPTQDGKM